MGDLPDIGVGGGIGALVGAALTWAGFKSRLDAQDERIKSLEEDAVSESTCIERARGCDKQFEDIKSLIREGNRQMREDIKQMHTHHRKEDEE